MKPLIAISAAVALAGCADQLLPDSKIANNTALALNLSPAAVRIVDRRTDGQLLTYYTAVTPAGSYHCVISGGSVVTFGITDPPGCEAIALPSAPETARHRRNSAAQRAAR